jgi:cell division protein FtsB
MLKELCMKKAASEKQVSNPKSRESIAALKRQVAQLEMENKELREHIGVLKKTASSSPPSYESSVREQQRNFFKYGGGRRY